MSAVFTAAAEQWNQIHADWLNAVEQLYLQAEAETRGHLLNKRGRDAGIDARSLVYGPEARVTAYASDELREFFAKHGRLTYAEFESQALGAVEPACPWCSHGGAA